VIKNVIICSIFIAYVFPVFAQSNFVNIEDDGWIKGMSVSSPVIYDIDGNGLYDLVIGDVLGNLRHYEQAGSGSGVFDFITYNFDNITIGGQGYASPVFEDIDNDGLIDMFVGRKDGRINRYEQATSNSLEFTLLTEYFANIDVILYASPAFTDIDDDGKLDLVVGGSGGYLDYWEQNSTNSTTFSYVGGIKKTATQYIDVGNSSKPTFTDLDNDGKLDMIVGEQSGNLNYYEQSSSTGNVFTLISDSYLGVQVSENSDPSICDLDNDNKEDLIIGCRDGRMLHYEQPSTTSTSFNLVTNYFYPIIHVPASNAIELYDITGNGKLDMFINNNGTIEYWAQYASNSAEFYFVMEDFSSINISSSIQGMDICDIDGDNLLDLIVGLNNSTSDVLRRYEQDAVGSTSFSYATLDLSGMIGDGHACPAVGHVDNDSYLDILIAKNDGYINHYEQVAVNSSTFTMVTNDFQYWGDMGTKPKIELTDFDSDGLEDLICSIYTDTLLYHYERNSGGSSWDFKGNIISGISYQYCYICPTAADVNGSGNPDLIVHENWGGRLLHYNNSSSSWGGTSNNWNDPANWNTGVVPDTLTEVILPGGLTNYPSISDTASCKSLELNTGATITISGGVLNVVGDDN